MKKLLSILAIVCVGVFINNCVTNEGDEYYCGNTDVQSCNPGDFDDDDPSPVNNQISVIAKVAVDSPEYVAFEGYVYEELKFELSASRASYTMTEPVFSWTPFAGQFYNCSLWEGNTLIYDSSTESQDPYGYGYISFTNPEEITLTTEPRTFSLFCQVETVSWDPQEVSIRFAGAKFIPEEGYEIYISGTDWGPTLKFVKQEALQFTLHPDSITPKELVPGANQTLMKFYMNTSAGQAEVYTLGFTFRNWFSGDYSNCRLQDSQGTVINSSASAGFDPNGGDDLYMTFFFGPQDGIYPGYGNTYKVGTNSQEIYVVCDVGYQPGHAMAIDLNYASLYTESVYNYKVLPDGYIKLTSTVYQ